ncbi:PP2C family protein-serine/threonine phosphatase [Streptomyces sp. NPDC006012]|uniref:PP2C family protein-serine/threonine phosphatase n=1 Tax=Streptomyces sp. NPDC006012 TaxID=3364739 RepID=UPI00367A0345
MSERCHIPAGNLLNVLEDVIEQAQQAVHDIAENGSSPEGTGTTLTAMREDRYLLCSDGLSTVVPTQDIHRALSEISEPELAVRELITLTNSSGGPDNVSCDAPAGWPGSEGDHHAVYSRAGRRPPVSPLNLRRQSRHYGVRHRTPISA